MPTQKKNKTVNKQLVVVVPWPHRYLSPNSRVLWQAKYQVSHKARNLARLLTLELIGCGNIAKPVDDLINIQLIAHAYDRRSRDEDNLIASMKPYLDGIADAIGVNDASFHFRELQFGPTKRPAEIEVWLTWKEAQGE